MYNISNFVRPLNDNDKIVTIYTSSGSVAYTINPYIVARTYISTNNVKINTNKNSVVTLEFGNNAIAKQAMVILQGQFDAIRRKKITETKAKDDAIVAISDTSDLVALYHNIFTTGTYSVSGATSSNIESRVIGFVENISLDQYNISQKKKYVNNYTPIDTFYNNDNTFHNMIGTTFSFAYRDDVQVFINGVHLSVNNGTQSACFLSNDNRITKTCYIQQGSCLYINPHKIGYDITPDDTVTIIYTN